MAGRSEPSEAQLDGELLSRRLVDFIGGIPSEGIDGAWSVLEPATVYRPNWHIEAICDHLEAVTSGQIKRLIINIPPRHMKSLAVAVFWPMWEWTIKPEIRWLFTSYGDRLVLRDSVKCRRLLESDWYRARWGHVFQLMSDQNQKGRFDNNRSGYRIATTVGGMGTGEGGDRVVVDDPHKVDEALSDLKRETTILWWDEVMSSRLNDRKTGARVIVMQRVHDQDLTGHVLAQGGYEHLCLPAEYEAKHPFVWPDDPRKDEGDLLWPNHLGRPELDSLKTEIGSPYAIAGQLQQRPAPAGGGIIRTAWWRYFDKDNLDHWALEPLVGLLAFWDTALKDGSQNDFCVGTLWGGAGANRYLLRRVRGRMNLPDTIDAVDQLDAWAERHFPRIPRQIKVENAANGPEVVAKLRDEISGISLWSPRDHGDKVARAHAITAELHAGQVIVPGRALPGGQGPDLGSTPEWVVDLIGECSSFPNGANDDQVDSVTGALLNMRGSYRRTPRGDDEARRSDTRQVTAGLANISF